MFALKASGRLFQKPTSIFEFGQCCEKFSERISPPQIIEEKVIVNSNTDIEHRQYLI